MWIDLTKDRRSDGSYVVIYSHCKQQLTNSSRSDITHRKNHFVIRTLIDRVTRKKLVVRYLVLEFNEAKNEGGMSIKQA